MKSVPQQTPIGELHGRDAIYLDSVTICDDCNTLELIGEFNCALATIPQDSNDRGYRITFRGVVALQIAELDVWESIQTQRPASSFDEVVDSPWKNSMKGKVTKQHRHYRFVTYDNVFEVITLAYELVLLDKRG